MQYGILMFPTQHPVDACGVGKPRGRRRRWGLIPSGWGSIRLPRAQYLALSGLPDGRIPHSYGWSLDPLVTLARASAVTTRLGWAPASLLVPERNLLLANESREMLGIRPPQASPEPQCLCPDTSA